MLRDYVFQNTFYIKPYWVNEYLGKIAIYTMDESKNRNNWKLVT